MSYLLGPQSDQSSAPRPISISEATERLKDLAAEMKGFELKWKELKWKQLLSERENEDMKQHLFRKEEGEKYNAVLAGRLCEDEQTRKKEKFEDSEICHEDEIVSIFSSFPRRS